jgi:hypothetical protein
MLSWSVRSALAGLVAAGATAAAVACGSASEGGSGGFGGPDGGADGGVYESGSGDGRTEGGAGDGGGNEAGGDAASPVTTALFVQASPALPAVRLCWSVNGALPKMVPFPSAGPMPGTNFEGVPLGGVAGLANADSLAGGSLQLYAIDAKLLAGLERGQGTSPSTCDELICGPGPNKPGACLWQDHNYWVVGQPLSIAHGAANVVAIEGCESGFTGAGAAVCGANWSTSGNLHADQITLSSPPESKGDLTFQALQLSPALALLSSDGGSSAALTFGTQNPAEAGPPLAALTLEGDLSQPITVPLPQALAGYGQLGFSYAVQIGDGGLAQWMSLAQSQQLVDPTEDPSAFFGEPRAYVVAIVGDPYAPPFGSTGDAGFDGTGLHILVLPTPVPAPIEAGAPPDSGAEDAGTGTD